MKNILMPTLLLATLLTACTSSGAFLSANQTIVNLNESNYALSATNIVGEAEESAYLPLQLVYGLVGVALLLLTLMPSVQYGFKGDVLNAKR